MRVYPGSSRLISSQTNDVIEGLHPVRSQHIVEYLHQYHPIEDTVLALTRIVEEDDLRGLFFHLPEYNIHDKDFFKSAVELLWDNDTFNRYIGIIEGFFAGEAQKYYQDNKAIFEEANRLSSILLFATETCPYVPNRNFGVEGIPSWIHHMSILLF